MSAKGKRKGSKGRKKKGNNYAACSVDEKITKGTEELEQLQEKKAEVEKRVENCKGNMKMVKLAIGKAEDDVAQLIMRHYSRSFERNLNFEIACLRQDKKRSLKLIDFYRKQCEDLVEKLKARREENREVE